MAIAGAVVALVGVGVSVRQGNRAAADQEAANLAQQQATTAARKRQREKAFAEAAKVRAQVRADAAARIGVGGTASAAQQAAGSITSQLASNLGFLEQQAGFENQRLGFLNSANRARGRGATARAIGGAINQGIQAFS